ncbi:hypothetical protein RhiXN_10579 [Rhizoctonia solani]|uniref:Uncharacterized protein n=1 Tax=Rhizoctonia solani TaxID=456999 RepID=A0A8H8P4D4_9AGAM|nr:uncharacterized protein RhiXN_10579 [Rhizoctonia solani]QRW24255.1 hypothetical protein RhiXN_10579 [Rhizoctonia solani]
MRSAVTSLLCFVALPVIPLSSTLDTLIEIVKDIVYLSRDLIVFGEHTERIVNQLASALKNKQLSQDTNTRKSLEELRKMFRLNSSHGAMFRLRRALFPEEDYTQVAHMRQQLDDALALFNLAANCELLARVPPFPNPVDRLRNPHHGHLNSSFAFNGLWREASQAPKRLCRIRNGKRELLAAGAEVNRLLHLFQRSRRPLLAMDLAIALSHYSELLVKSGCTADALAASQESARLFRSLAEKGPEVYHDAY